MLTKPISVEEIKDNCAHTSIVHVIGEKYEAMHDGENFLIHTVNDSNEVIGFTRYGGNNPFIIIEDLEKTFNIKIISEHD